MKSVSPYKSRVLQAARNTHSPHTYGAKCLWYKTKDNVHCNMCDIEIFLKKEPKCEADHVIPLLQQVVVWLNAIGQTWETCAVVWEPRPWNSDEKWQVLRADYAVSFLNFCFKRGFMDFQPLCQKCNAWKGATVKCTKYDTTPRIQRIDIKECQCNNSPQEQPPMADNIITIIRKNKEVLFCGLEGKDTPLNKNEFIAWTTEYFNRDIFSSLSKTASTIPDSEKKTVESIARLSSEWSPAVTSIEIRRCCSGKKARNYIDFISTCSQCNCSKRVSVNSLTIARFAGRLKKEKKDKTE